MWPIDHDFLGLVISLSLIAILLVVVTDHINRLGDGDDD